MTYVWMKNSKKDSTLQISHSDREHTTCGMLTLRGHFVSLCYPSDLEIYAFYHTMQQSINTDT